MYQSFDFVGRKPSKAQALAKQGNTEIEIFWGENFITLMKQGINNVWCGFCWIKDISGNDIAQALNQGAK
jgi:hypothetical protein